MKGTETSPGGGIPYSTSSMGRASGLPSRSIPPRSPAISTPHKGRLDALGYRETFGFNFDPSHLYWQFVDPAKFIYRFPDRIYHAHMKDALRILDGESGILSSHLPFGDHRRGWDFRSVGRGGVDFEAVIRALNRIGYDGPLSVEWEDAGMDRVHGARESATFVRRIDFEPAAAAFDAAFGRE
jgi:sugar phosphate isomerase/epimerase